MRSVFLKNAAILTTTSLLLRLLGMWFRIFLSNAVGAEGMGVYQLILSVYVLVSTLSSCGISTAVTRLVTDELVHGSRDTLRRLMRFAVLLSIGVGLLSFAVVFSAAEPIARFLLGDVRTVPSLRILGIGLPFIGISACLKGYFLARRRVTGNSLAQMLEQLCRIGCIWLLLSRFADGDITRCCACIMIGDTAAETASCLFMACCYGKDRRQTVFLPPHSAHRPLLRPFAEIALPLSAGRTLTTLLHTAENLLVPNRLAVYTGSREHALSSFGTLKGMALPLLFFPSSLLSAFSTLLIPEMTEAQSRGQHKRVQSVVSRTLHLTIWASTGFATVFTALAMPLGRLLYGSEEVGLYLTVLAPLVPAMYAESITDGLLKGLGHQTATLRFCLIDSAARIALTVILLPRFGMAGFLFVMLLSNTLSCFLNLHHLLSVTDVRLRIWRMILCPTFAAALCDTAFFAVRNRIGLSPDGYIPIAVSAIVILCAYTVLSICLGCIRLSDLLPAKPRHLSVSAPILTPVEPPDTLTGRVGDAIPPFAENGNK